ncbi:hypothetical protein AFA91_31115 [Mycolicibacterium goodii]|uniref:Uncharacterized protein n=1 Tax=Mycolicibacterium goodii TaxID=134601 RepID=A0A0K0XHA6_MYCGD|nr:hypothetical protein AFA91_31115 [Mycolicibacterium goodii]
MDAAVILAPGREILDVFTEYVTACRVLGYGHRDLTRLHEWYDTEDGVDLRALDAEQRALTAAAQAAEQALRLQDKQSRLADDGWQGSAAMSAREHLARHHAAAEQTVAALHTAAAALDRLREALCEALTRKSAVTVEIEGRHAAQRAGWLAAARTVATGVAGDRSAASELIDQEVRPFVAGGIAGDWVAAMRSTTAAVTDAYADAVAALRAAPTPVFGHVAFGDSGVPAPVVEPRPTFERTVPAGHVAADTSWPAPPPAAQVMPAAQVTPAAPVTPPAQVTPPAPAAELPPAPAVSPLPAAGQSLGLPGMPGMADPAAGLGSGLAGAGQQLADLFSGLVGSAAEGIPDADALDAVPDDDVDDPEIADEPDGSDDPEDDVEENPEEDPEEPVEPVEPVEGAAAEEAAETAVEPADEAETPEAAAPQEETPAPIVPPPPVAEPLSQPSGETPCEIAADELPQVGS